MSRIFSPYVKKKGDIPITILVLMVVILCMLVILSFSYSLGNARNSFIGMGLIETVKSFSEEQTFVSQSAFDSGSLFTSDGVSTYTTEDGIEGVYKKKEAPLIGSGKEKILVRVIYQRR